MGVSGDVSPQLVGEVYHWLGANHTPVDRLRSAGQSLLVTAQSSLASQW